MSLENDTDIGPLSPFQVYYIKQYWIITDDQ